MSRLLTSCAALLALCALPIGVAAAQEKVTVWWAKGFYESEDQALNDAIAKFEDETGIEVELSLFGGDDGLIKAVSAIEAGSPPDVGYSHTYDFRATNLWAYEGKLDAVDDVVAAMADRLQPAALDAVTLMNGQTGERGVFAVPVAQSSIHIFYWKDMLEDAGFTEADIPSEWSAFWAFWCDDVQPALRDKGQRVYGIGLPISSGGSDTYDIFMQFLAAYDVDIVDRDGNVVLDTPENREGLIAAMKDYVAIYENSCTPQSALTWANADNNTAFHNRSVVMTPNATLSIPASYLEDDTEGKYARIGTGLFPNRVDGTPMSYRSAVKTAVVFEGAKNKEGGHKFLSFLMQPENINPLIDGALGRWFPVTTDGVQTELWLTPDPHRATILKQFENVEPHPFVYNFRIMRLTAEGLLGRALLQIIQEGQSPEAAADWLIANVQEIAAE